MCYHVKFGSPATKGVCINRKEPPKLGSAGAPPLAVGAWLNRKKYAPPHTCYLPEFSRSRSNCMSVIKGIRLKI